VSDEQHSRLAQLLSRYESLDAADLVRVMIAEEFPGKIALVSSFGAEAAALLHMVAQADPATDVVFLDTGKMFGETRRYRDQLVEHLGLRNARVVTPDPAAVTVTDPKGMLWAQDADACCRLRKVEPLARALAPYDAWFTGRKAFQNRDRADLTPIELADGRFKVNPLARWTKDEIMAYYAANDLPPHPLVADGYLSIGCMPCTSRVEAGEDERSGRWRGKGKTECGIHAGQHSPQAVEACP